MDFHVVFDFDYATLSISICCFVAVWFGLDWVTDPGQYAYTEVWARCGLLVNYRARSFEVSAKTRNGAPLCGQ